jgi:hypothetical protein
MAYRYKHLENKSCHLLKIHIRDIELHYALTSGSFKKAVMTTQNTSVIYAPRPCRIEGFEWLSQLTRTITVEKGVEVITTWDFEYKNCDIVIRVLATGETA